jgi:hypothetical protein
MSLLLQRLNQSLIKNDKATNTRQVFESNRAEIDADPNAQVIGSSKSFSIADAVSFIKEVMDEFKPETFNACGRNLCSEAVNDFKYFPGINGELKKIIHTVI